MTRPAAALGTSILLAAACSSAGPAPTNVAFDRPGRFVFACYDVSTSPPEPHPLAFCDPDPTDGTFMPSHDLHAIVLQTARGQLGLVDVQPLATSALIDSNPTVPGYTFLAIGDQPVDIAASDGKTGAPLTTYIAHRGSRDLWWIATRELRRVATSLPWHTVALGGEPTSIVLSPNEDFLFVALSDVGVVRQYPIDPLTGDLGMPTEVQLDATVPAAVTAATIEPPWQHVCAPLDPPVPAVIAPRVPRSRGMAPTPVRLALQTRDMTTPGDALIVADSSLPVLHVIPVGVGGLDRAGMHRVNIGTPTTDVVVTPSVPANTLSGNLINRYLYALDDRGDVITVDWTSGVPTQGMVLPVGPATSRAADRITFGTPGSTLAVLSPGFPDFVSVALPSCDYVDGAKAALPVGPLLGPAHLRGVFLAVGLFDGTVRIVDVWDSDALCRGAPEAPDGSDLSECAVAAGSDGTDSTVYIRRHRPRVGAVIGSAATVTVAPTFTVAGVSGAVDTTGSAGSGLPTLVDIGDATGGGDCTAAGLAAANVELGMGYPPDTSLPTTAALVCVGVDPWSTLTQSFSATYEGALSGNYNGRFGHFAGTSQFFTTGDDFCDDGVIGSVEGAAATAIVPSFAAANGDQLVITAIAPTDPVVPGACDAYLGTPPVALEILHAYPDGHLDLGAELDPATGMPTGRTGAADCFTELTTFEVRTRGTWLVRGGTSGPLTRVIHGATEMDPCAVDTSDAARGKESRAVTGTLFVNRDVAFTIGDSGSIVPNATLTFGVGGQPGSLAISAGTLPVAIRFSSVDQKMYVVDPLLQGLSRINLDGYTVEVHYSNQ